MRIEIDNFGDFFVVYIDCTVAGIFLTRDECEEWLSANVDEAWRDYEVTK